MRSVIVSRGIGLDTIELVLRTEEIFSVDLPDDGCARVVTVGDLYRLLLGKLQLPYLPAAEAESLPYRVDRSRIFHLQPWTTPDVWANLKAIIMDHLQVPEDEVHESARFLDDLRCD